MIAACAGVGRCFVRMAPRVHKGKGLGYGQNEMGGASGDHGGGGSGV